MLHNSLLRRDLLLAMNANPLVLKRRDVHRNIARRDNAKPAAGQMEMSGAWSVRTARDAAAERAVADDAADFLKRIGVTIDPSSSRQVLLEVGSEERGFRCVVAEDRVEVHADGAAALWAGWVHLENAMRTAGAAIVPIGEHRRQPAWDIQIAPPTWGANYSVPDLSKEFLGDDTFRSLAHAGADGLFVYGDFLLYAQDTRLAELNQDDAAKHIATLRDASERAAPFGVKLYFVAVSPKLPADHPLFKRLPETRGAQLAHHPGSSAPPLHCLCSSSADALGFHADVFANLFKQVSQLGGVILIIGGESYYHCFMRVAGSRIGHTNCPHCEGKTPEDVIANFLKITADAATKSNPHAKVMAWPYSAQYFWSDEPNQLKLIDRLPPNVALLSEIDKDQTVLRGGYPKRIWDYSVDYDDHSDRIVAQSLRCAQRERDLFIKTETSHGIELLHLPYVPAIGRSARQWQSVRALRPRGVLQRWGFIGMFDSAAERIGYLARWDPNFTPESATLAVARELFGGELAPQIVAAWKHFDDAVHHIPLLTTGAYYTGPAFLGPCHPLPVWDSRGAVPDAFKGNLYYLAESEATFSSARRNAKDDLTLTSTKQLGLFGDEGPIAAVISEFSLAHDAARAGHELLAKIDASQQPATVRDEIIEQQALGEYLYRTFVATVNTIRFIHAIEQNPKSQISNLKSEIPNLKSQLVELAQDELANARAARGIYEKAPWLNHALRLDVGAPDSLAMLDEKVRLLEQFLQ
jgi:hypothetical protein